MSAATALPTSGPATTDESTLSVLYADVTRAMQRAELHHARNRARANRTAEELAEATLASREDDSSVAKGQQSTRTARRMNGYNCACIMPTAALPSRPPSHLRFVCASDTHGLHRHVAIPLGDVFIHAGDIAMRGSPSDCMALYSDFNAWLGTLPHPHKFVIGGNHDRILDTSLPGSLTVAEVRALFSNATYLFNEEAFIPLPDDASLRSERATARSSDELGVPSTAPPFPARKFLRVFGSPFSYGKSGRHAFQGRRLHSEQDGTAQGEPDDGLCHSLLKAASGREREAQSVARTEAALIAQLRGAAASAEPTSATERLASPLHAPLIDVLITHHSVNSEHSSDFALTTAILGPDPVARVHVGGHYHRFYGARVHSTQPDGAAASAAPVVAVNASVLNSDYALVRGAVVFDMM